MSKVLLRIRVYFLKIEYNALFFELEQEGRRKESMMSFTEYLLKWYRKNIK